MSEASILDVLTETEKWLDLHKFFGPLSGFEAKIDDPRKRFITTLFCYGCNLGPVQTARSVKGLSRKQVAWLNLKHVTEQRLDKAIVKVVNAYNRFALPRYWGSGKSASADGTKWNVFEQKPAFRVSHPLRRLRRNWLLPCVGQVHCVVQPFHPMWRL